MTGNSVHFLPDILKVTDIFLNLGISLIFPSTFYDPDLVRQRLSVSRHLLGLWRASPDG